MRSTVWSRALTAPCLAALVGGVAVSLPSAGVAAAAGAQQVHPGAIVRFLDTSCKAGSLLRQGKTVYVAIPASCAALPNDEGAPQWGCAQTGRHQSAASAPIGTPVKVDGAKHPAVLVYDSFTRMQSKGMGHGNKCVYNDLALVRLSHSDAQAAMGALPGLNSPRHVSHRPPASGSHLSSDGASATAGATTHGGWLYELSQSPPVTGPDVGTPFVQGAKFIGMLTQTPQGMITKTPAGISNFSRALDRLRKTRGFHHVKLLRAGQQV